MRAIIIEDKDACALVDKLKLKSLRETHQVNEEMTLSEMHRLFHYEVVKWLQDQGATVTR